MVPPVGVFSYGIGRLESSGAEATRPTVKFPREGILGVSRVNACSQSLSYITHYRTATCIPAQCQFASIIPPTRYEHRVRNSDFPVHQSNPERRDMCLIAYGPLCRPPTIARMDISVGYRFRSEKGRHRTAKISPILGPMEEKLFHMEEIVVDDTTSLGPPPPPEDLCYFRSAPAFPTSRAFS